MECFSGNIDDHQVNSNDNLHVSAQTQQSIAQDSRIDELNQRVTVLEEKIAQLESLLN